MPAPTLLATRAIIRLSPGVGESAADFLQGLVTNDVAGALPVWAGLLTAQGKALFDFIVWPGDNGDLLLDCEADAANALVRRLSIYRLRRAITIARDPAIAVHWSPDLPDGVAGAAPDPRLAELGWRWLAPASTDTAAADPAWQAHRLTLGVTEGRAELGDGETLWLECNAADLHGVSFTKGCYIGQENTARMNWRQKVARRLVVVPIAQSIAARQRLALPELGYAIDHRRVEDIAASEMPGWMAPG